jgi:hypothetical protein
MMFKNLVALCLASQMVQAKELSNSEQSKVKAAIQENNLEALKTLLKDRPSWPEFGEFGRGGGQYILWLATNPTPWHTGRSINQPISYREHRVCRPQIVKHLLAEGVKPTEEFFGGETTKNGHLRGAIMSGCGTSVELLVPKMSKRDVMAATFSFKTHEFEDIVNDPEKAPLIVKTAQVLIEFNKANCNDTDEGGAFCEAEKHIKTQIKNFVEAEERRMKAESPEGRTRAATREICYEQEEIERVTEEIHEEKEKGKVSGLVDLIKLKNWGDELYERHKKQEAFKKAYQDLTKKKFNMKDCSE